MKKSVFFFLFLVLLCNSAMLLAQTEPEDITPETDKFEDYFYESLKQKGIENYDRAIMSLEQCLKVKPNDAVVYSEMGKNYLVFLHLKKRPKLTLKTNGFGWECMRLVMLRKITVKP
jgi:tetratricopeptide (TPR) repeat protein